MQYSITMSVIKSRQYVHENAHSNIERQSMIRATLQQCRQRFTLYEAHHHTLLVVDGEGIKQPDNMGMVQTGMPPDLILKTCLNTRVCEKTLGNNLYRDTLPAPAIPSLPDDTHPAFPENPFKHVFAARLSLSEVRPLGVL